MSAGGVLGAEGQPGVGAMGLERLADMAGFERHAMAPLGADILSHWRPRED
jgi:diaminohydroxyphosphoribosylaminopyrimidine deaminase/5-amino-6-(5-phosphoribosylamino)uracil reductase